MTSEEKLAKIIAQRALRGIISQRTGTINLFETIHLLQSQSDMDLTGGEFDVFERLKTALKVQDINKKSDRELEAEMELVNEFKKLLSKQFDQLINKMVVELAG